MHNTYNSDVCFDSDQLQAMGVHYERICQGYVSETGLAPTEDEKNAIAAQIVIWWSNRVLPPAFCACKARMQPSACP